MIPVIISGGSGSRLWPVSRLSYPKPFIKLSDGISLFQNTLIRAIGLPNVTRIVVVTNESLFYRMKDEFTEINHYNLQIDFILEPYGRNTAPAIAAACLYLSKLYSKNEPLLIMPADHLITDSIAFNKAVHDAQSLVNKNFIVTFGITPQYPEIGYGYIEADFSNPIESGYSIKRFVEKPNLEKAQQYLSSKSYLWNSGMFCGLVNTFIDEFKLYSPDLLNSTNNCIINSKQENAFDSRILHLNRELFLHSEDISIDYALIEKSNNIGVVPCSIGWSDIGSWLSIFQSLPKDDSNNAIIGESILHNTKDCLVYSTDRIIACVDLNDLIIVDTPDAILIADKHKSQNVKIIFDKLKQMKHHTYSQHQTNFRSWGTYTIIEEGSFYKIKKLEIKPHSFVLMQSHHYKNEHWVVVEGSAKITTNDKTYYLLANESTYIRPNAVHKLENNTDKNLIIIKIQSGEYIGDDDINKIATFNERDI